jgi:hypothetical protein
MKQGCATIPEGAIKEARSGQDRSTAKRGGRGGEMDKGGGDSALRDLS